MAKKHCYRNIRGVGWKRDDDLIELQSIFHFWKDQFFEGKGGI